MNTNVYVAGLPQDVTEDTFRQIFESYGLITSLKACRGKGPTSPGFGFVRFQTEQEAQDAIAATDGLDFGGQTLTVRLANEPASGTYAAYAPAVAGKGFGKSGPPVATLAQRNIYVAGLPQFTNDMALSLNMFKGFGNVLSVKLGADVKADRKYGFVNFEHPEEAAYAIENMNGKPVQGVALQVRYANADKIQGSSPSYDSFNYTPPSVKEYSSHAAGLSNPQPSDNLYVKGLPAGMTELEVQTLFGGYGEVSSCKVLDQGTHGYTVSMVRMVNMEDAKWVVDNVNGNIPDGFQNQVQIRYADPPKGSVVATPAQMPQAWTSKTPVSGPVKQAPQTQRFSPYGASAPQTVQVVLSSAATPELMQAVSETVSEVKGFRPLAKHEEDPSNLYVKGLPVNADELYIYYVFAPFGAIQSVRVMRDDTGVCSGTALVKFGSAEDAELAISTLTGNPLPDHVVLDVSVKTVKGDRKSVV